MSKFQAFLKGNVKRIETKNIVVSEAFKDENGENIPFVIKTMQNNLWQQLRDKNTSTDEKGNTKVDAYSLARDVIAESVHYPDLKDAELQESYDALGEKELIDKMLLVGEVEMFFQKICEFNGFKEIPEKVEEVKN
ncbi:phage tail assembly chaperone [Peptostreptococcus faecalis]|uniref:phage tail assembly chaperone n=1 Tax=Peptostreptococcus faecalis TaxID=2045015 RepID=UPI000C7D6755|nr:phage portal protein [Peptostreptococcus faecalis]